MNVIVGLGNPGKKYENTRHNVGFMAVDYLADKHDIKVNKIKFKALVGDGNISGQKVLLVKPQTYMNLSGESIRQVMEYYRLETEALTVIYDDIDVLTGYIRIRKKGSAGSHNGMRSIIYQLQDDNFPRIRIGIGREEPKGALADYVLDNFARAEIPTMEKAVMSTSDAIECMLSDGIDLAMNRYNIRPEKKMEQNEE